jgi:hypothetical protein
MPKTFTTVDISKHFNVPVWQILQTIRRGFLVEPLRVKFFRVWDADDLPRVRQALTAAGYLAEEAGCA